MKKKKILKIMWRKINKMYSIIIFILYILIGFLMDYSNNLGIKFTTRKFLNNKNQAIIFLSLFIRLFIFAIVFYFLTRNNFKKAIFFIFGVILSKFLFIIKYNRISDANNNR